MRLAIASGKGGTGKTTLAVSLARVAEGPVALLDCDVEEPNCHIFLPYAVRETEEVSVPVPVVDERLCTACGECAAVCRYNAIAALGAKALVFPELCHGCGGCTLVCPEKAIREEPRRIGVVEAGAFGAIEIVTGRLDVGAAMSPPVIRAVKRRAAPSGLVILDCPPGTSCPVVTAVRGSDYVVLVTEPTPFGLNDLTLAVETMRALGLPFGVVVNRADSGDRRVFEYCRREGIPVLAEIPDDRRVAEAISEGGSAIEALPRLSGMLRGLLSRVEREARLPRGAA